MSLQSEVPTVGHQACLLRPHLQVSVRGLHQRRLPQPQQQEEERGGRHPAEGNPAGAGEHLEYQQLTATITLSKEQYLTL